MSIYFGNDIVKDLYVGLTPVSKGYVGTHLFYNGDNTIIDITYEKYILNTRFSTLYNTAEKPVKSAILKGQTLVNLVNNDNWVEANNGLLFTQNISIKKGQTYTVIGQMDKADHSGDTASDPAFKIYGGTDNTGAILVNYQTSKIEIRQTFINYHNNSIYLRFFNQKTNYKKLMIIEGDYTNVNITYFESTQSVKIPVLKTTGKNLFDVSYYVQGVEEKLCYSQNGDKLQINALDNRSEMMHAVYKVKKGETLTLSTNPELPIRIYLINQNSMITDTPTYTAREDCEIGLKFVAHEYPTLVEVQLEKGSTATSYEPFKSNILTVNEDVTLRSNGDVYDELNLLTGRLTQRIDENNEVLSQEVVKTVDLSVVDQDGNNTKLSTFDDLTHVTLSSEEVIPEAELEVATKNEEVLSTMSLEMDDISATQTTLEETSNTQSENVDATMIATTEIYEELL